MLRRLFLALDSTAFDALELGPHRNPLVIRRRLPRQIRKQELLSEQQLDHKEKRERGLDGDGENRRPKKRTAAERRIGMIKEEEIKAGVLRAAPGQDKSDQSMRVLQSLKKAHEIGATTQKWTNLANEVHHLVDELKTRELATVLMVFAEAGYRDRTQGTSAIVKRLMVRTDVTSCLMAMMALQKSGGKEATPVLKELSETFIRLAFDKGVETANGYNIAKMTFADLRLTAAALARLPFLHSRLEDWFVDDLFNSLTEKVPHVSDPRTLLSILYAAARLRVSPNHPCLLAIVPQIRLLLLSRVPTTIKDDFNCLDACYTLGYDNLSRVLAIHAQRNLAAVEDLDDLIAVGRKIKENGAENAQTWIPWCEAVDERLQALQNDEFYTKALSQRNIADIERTFTTLRRSLRHVNAFKVKHGRQAVTDGLTNPALSVEGF